MSQLPRPKFLPRPVTEKIARQLWRFVTPFGPIPAGFVSDGGTIPKIFWWFLDPATELFEASVIHDYWLCQNETAHAHAEFKRVALEYGVPKFKVYVAHTAIIVHFALKSWWKKL